jgi:hypothetical protein
MTGGKKVPTRTRECGNADKYSSFHQVCVLHSLVKKEDLKKTLIETPFEIYGIFFLKCFFFFGVVIEPEPEFVNV